MPKFIQLVLLQKGLVNLIKPPTDLDDGATGSETFNMPCLEADCGLGSRNLTVTSLPCNDRHMPLAYSKSAFKKGGGRNSKRLSRAKPKSISVKTKYTI